VVAAPRVSATSSVTDSEGGITHLTTAVPKNFGFNISFHAFDFNTKELVCERTFTSTIVGSITTDVRRLFKASVAKGKANKPSMSETSTRKMMSKEEHIRLTCAQPVSTECVEIWATRVGDELTEVNSESTGGECKDGEGGEGETHCKQSLLWFER
jgi:hypothetical protein